MEDCEQTGSRLITGSVLLPHAPVLVPSVGGDRLRQVAATHEAMRRAARQLLVAAPDTLVVISPHSPRDSTAFTLWTGPELRGGLDQFGSEEPPFELPVDSELARELKAAAREEHVPVFELGRRGLDHGATVPLWMFVEAGWKGPVLVLGLHNSSQQGFEELSRALHCAARILRRRLGIVASGDMSHALRPHSPAGYHPAGKQFDEEFIRLLREANYHALVKMDPDLRDNAAEDAVDSTVLALHFCGWQSDGHEVLSYEGCLGVGYGVAVLHLPPPQSQSACEAELTVGTDVASSHEGELLPLIARQSVSALLCNQSRPQPTVRSPYLLARRGVFVTIRTLDGELRGCIGCLTPREEDLVAETWRAAQAAASSDPRFSPVRAEELDSLRFEVTVLGDIEPIQSESDLDPSSYGVIVSTKDGRRGVLLPGIEGIDTVRQQIDCVRKKARINPSEPVELSRFTVEKFFERQP